MQKFECVSEFLHLYIQKLTNTFKPLHKNEQNTNEIQDNLKT
jgi:hypothetical protein